MAGAGAGGDIQGLDRDLGGRAHLPVLPPASDHCLLSRQGLAQCDLLPGPGQTVHQTAADRAGYCDICFLGISIISDMFRSAIEKITAATKQIHIASSEDNGEEVIEVPVWNGTVANLTLLPHSVLAGHSGALGDTAS